MAESVPAARAGVAAFAQAAGVHGEQLDAICLATSEAVTNAVLHAYDGGSGSFQVTASYTPGEIWVLVSDDGVGLRPGRAPGGLGVGLAVIAQLADEFEIVRRSTGGTELQMRFRFQLGGRAPEPRPRQSTLIAA